MASQRIPGKSCRDGAPTSMTRRSVWRRLCVEADWRERSGARFHETFLVTEEEEVRIHDADDR